jgi:hypothetical protein
VEFSEPEISGIRALKLTGLRVVTKTDPQFGEFVCKIGDVGPEASECPASDGSFWSYFRLDSNGVWRVASTGASSTKVRCGDGEGWAWFPRGVGPPPTGPASVSSMCPGRTCGDQPGPNPTDGGSSTPPSSGSTSGPRTPTRTAPGRISSSPPLQDESAEGASNEATAGPSTTSTPTPRLASRQHRASASSKWVAVGALILASSFVVAYVKFRRRVRPGGDA